MRPGFPMQLLDLRVNLARSGPDAGVLCPGFPVQAPRPREASYRGIEQSGSQRESTTGPGFPVRVLELRVNLMQTQRCAVEWIPTGKHQEVGVPDPGAEPEGESR